MTHGNNQNEAERAESNVSRVRRRRFLSGVGATALSSPLVGSAAGRAGDARSIYERANEIRTKAGQRAWKLFLQSQGIQVASVSTAFNKTEDGVSIQHYDNVDGSPSDCDICLNFSLLWNSFDYHYAIDCSWTYDPEGFFNAAEDPYDVLGLYYNAQHWDYDSNNLYDTSYTSNKGVVEVSDDTVENGLAFVIEDSISDEDEYYWAGVKIQPTGDYSSSERYVYGEYTHASEADEVNVTPSLSYPGGLSLNYNTSEHVKKESTTTEGDGETLMKLSQSDAEDI